MGRLPPRSYSLFNMSAADKIYRKILIGSLAKSKFFTKGWGGTEIYESLARMRKHVCDRNECFSLDLSSPSIRLKKIKSATSYEYYTGQFTSPLVSLSPGLLPPEAETASFELLVPGQWSSTSDVRPMYIHLAGTGDHYFWRRRTLTAEPLLNKSGVGAVLLENPFYGSRKPKEQVRSYLLHVSDLMVMGLALILECLVLYRWLKSEGYGPLGITGLSMGGHNASLASTVWPERHAAVPCLSWTTAATVFTKGLLSDAVSWCTLQEQLHHCRQRQDSLWKFFKHHLPTSLEGGNPNESAPSATKETAHVTQGPSGPLSWRGRLKPYVETVDVMNNLLDYATHLRHFSQPVDGTSTIFVAAHGDHYVPRRDELSAIWPSTTHNVFFKTEVFFSPESEVRYVSGGHISTSIFKQKFIRSVLQEAMERQLSIQTCNV